MPKLLRVSGAEALKAMQKLGFEKVRRSGSRVITRRGPKGCVIAMHPELKTGTLAGLLRQADVSVEDFIAALRKRRLTSPSSATPSGLLRKSPVAADVER